MCAVTTVGVHTSDGRRPPSAFPRTATDGPHGRRGSCLTRAFESGVHPFYVIRAIGSLLFLLGALIMAFNLWRTVYPREEIASVATMAPAE